VINHTKNSRNLNIRVCLLLLCQSAMGKRVFLGSCLLMTLFFLLFSHLY